MCAVRRGTLRTGGKLRQLTHTVIRPSHPLTAFRRFSFWYTHNIRFWFSLKFQIIQRSPYGRRVPVFLSIAFLTIRTRIPPR